MKKLLVFAFLFMFAFQSMSLAAVSGSKGATSAPRAPRVSQPTPSPTAPSQAAPGYKPSAPANSYNDKAPAPTARPQQPQAPQSTGNSFLRTAAMIGGGMLLGSMLAVGLLGTAMTQGLIAYAASAALPHEQGGLACERGDEFGIQTLGLIGRHFNHAVAELGI